MEKPTNTKTSNSRKKNQQAKALFLGVNNFLFRCILYAEFEWKIQRKRRAQTIFSSCCLYSNSIWVKNVWRKRKKLYLSESKPYSHWILNFFRSIDVFIYPHWKIESPSISSELAFSRKKEYIIYGIIIVHNKNEIVLNIHGERTNAP